ncbi:MAG: leucine-rich repeat protein, partial [Muribaculaceae bacterium]|nr:leucine-rich repeat protein [Muribaculaceae bacterium]
MKKKFTLLLVAVLMAGLGFSATAAVGDVFTSGNYRYKVIAEGDVNEVEFAPKASGSYNISSTSAFSSISTVTNNGITYTIVGVGEYAFENAQFPTSGNTNMPRNIRYISDYAFKGVKSGSSSARGSIRFYGDVLRYVSSKAFLDNDLQGSVLITTGDAENGFSQVNSDAKSSYTSGSMYLAAERGTKYFMFPKSYPLGTSSGWAPAYQVTINSAITSIGAYAMMNCTNYKTVNLSNVEEIDTAAFKNTKLTSLTLPASIRKIAADAFEGVTTIKSMTINCDLTADMADVVFDDAVYTELKEKVVFGDGVDVSAYKNNPNWGRFFDVPETNVYILGNVNGNSWATNVGVQMTTLDNITYTATVTTENADDNGTPNNYFSFTTALAETADDWAGIADYRFGAVTDGGNFLVTKAMLEQNLSLEMSTDPHAFQITQGTWKLTLNLNAMTLYIEKVMPDVWVMGTVNGNDWAANVGDKMTWDNSNKTYTKRVTVTGEYGYFSFTTALGADVEDWNSIAGNRFGAVSNGDFEVTRDMVHNGQSLSLSDFGTANAFKIPAGTFDLTISDLDENTRNLVITGNFIDEVDTIPFNVGMFKYRRLNNNGEVEMLGYNEDNADASLLKANFSGLSTVTYEGTTYNIVSIGEEAFAGHGMGGQFTIEPMSHLREIKKGAFRNVGRGSGTALARPLGLPNSLQTIGDEAFAGSVVSVLTIPANVTSIGNGIVAGGLRLNSISVASGNTAYKAVNGDIYTLDGKTLVAAAPQKATLTVADGCETIAPEAVMNIPETNTESGAVKMTTIVLPSTLTTIGENAFAGSKTFTSVTCNAVNPPTGGVFDAAVYRACANQLVVPEGSEAAYRADQNWGNFYWPVYTVTVAQGIEHGTVVANKAEYIEDETVILTITPDEGYELTNFSVMNGETPVETTAIATGVTFAMPAANVTVNATFTIVDYTITVANNIEHGTVVADKQTANLGETVTLTVTPAEGYELGTLTVMNGETAVETTATETGATFVMPAADVNVNATFAIVNYEIVVAECDHGTVVADKQTANLGETVTLTVTPDAGCELKSLEVIAGADTPVQTTLDNETGTYTFEMPAEIVSVVAEFDYVIEGTTLAQALIQAENTEVRISDELLIATVEPDGFAILTDNNGNWIASHFDNDIATALGYAKSVKAGTLQGTITNVDTNPMLTLTLIPEAGESNEDVVPMNIDMTQLIDVPGNCLATVSGYYADGKLRAYSNVEDPGQM